MAADIAPELLKRIRENFINQLEKDDLAAELLERISVGKGTYETAGSFAEQVGSALSKAMQANLSSDVLPDGKMYWNIADRVLRPLLQEDYEIISDAAMKTQEYLNQAAGLGLKAQKASLNQDRIDGLLNKVANAEKFDDVAWVLGEPVLTFSRSVVDDTLKKNVEFQGKAGLSPKIVRRAESKCCKWCRNLAGTYDYPDVPKEVYQRHDNCRCVVEYNPGDGKRKTVHSGTEGKRRYVKDEYGNYNLSKNARIERAKQMEITEAERKRIAREKRIATWKNKKATEVKNGYENVMPEYIRNAAPGKGKVTTYESIDSSLKIREIKTADWIVNTFGGDVDVLQEINMDHIKTSDFLWNKTETELKCVSSKKAVDSALRKANKQISGTGRIIVDITNCKENNSDMLDEIALRTIKRTKTGTDVIVKKNREVLGIIRNKR